MAKVMTLGGLSERGLGADDFDRCKCVYNPRTKRSALLCFVGKGKKTRSGWQFRKGAAQYCRR